MSDGSTSERTIVVSGGYLYRPQPSFFDDELAQQHQFDVALGRETLRRIDPFCQAALYAVERARSDCRDPARGTHQPSDRQGVVVATGLGAQATRVRYIRRLAKLGPSATNPIDFPDSIDGAAAAHIAMRWGLNGPSLTFVDGRQTAEAAVVAACRHIALDRADRIYLVVGDIFEPWLKRQIEDAFTRTGDVPGPFDVAGSERPHPRPVDAVLALVLDRFDATVHRATDVRITCAPDEAGAVMQNRQFRAVTAPKESSLDLSGVLGIAGAWLEVSAPMGKWMRSCQDGTVDATSIKVDFGPSTHLAFWRKVDGQ